MTEVAATCTDQRAHPPFQSVPVRKSASFLAQRSLQIVRRGRARSTDDDRHGVAEVVELLGGRY